MKFFSFYDNNDCIYNKLCNNNNYDKISYINYANLILHKFKFTFYLIKFKYKFHQWLWKSREKKIILEMHPDNVINLFYSEIYENY